jgi:serine phosphatase RsbU (regulator of sigma subunit)
MTGDSRHDAPGATDRFRSLLADASGALAATLDPDQVLRCLSGLVVPALADGCEVAVLADDGGVQRFVRAAGLDDDRRQRREKTPVTLDDEGHPIAQVLRTGEPVRLDASGGLAAFGPADIDTTASSFGINEAVIVPMTVRGQVIGALALGVGPSGRHVDDLVIDVATELGARAALCYDNARLYCQQRDIAETLQRSLLPPALPEPGWIELAARYWIPGPGVEVGGDFYDVVETPGAVLLVIGDVCGKGVEAAALTGLARHTIRAALTHGRDAVEALRWLHDAFRAQAPDSFVTALIVRLVRDASGGVVGEAVSGGHPPSIVLRGDGTTETLEGGGTAPGLPVHRDAPVVPFTLGVGDALVLYTDGVTDVPGEGGMSVEGFGALVAGAASSCAEDLATRIGAALEQVRPRARRTDDIALVVTRVPTP